VEDKLIGKDEENVKGPFRTKGGELFILMSMFKDLAR